MKPKTFLSEVLEQYRGLRSYVDSGVVIHELIDERGTAGQASITFKTLYKAPTRFYCHYEFNMGPPFEDLITKTSIGYNGKEAFLFERENGESPRIEKGSLGDILSKSTSSSIGLTSDIAALLMPNTGSAEIVALEAVSFDKESIVNEQICFTVNGSYRWGIMRLELMKICQIVYLRCRRHKPTG